MAMTASQMELSRVGVYLLTERMFSKVKTVFSLMGGSSPRPGDVVGLSFGPEDIHIMKKSERKKVNYFSSFKNEDNDVRVEEEEIEQ